MIAARLVHVTGQVQGVGFRPFVHRLASRHHLSGWVRNTSGNVEIEVEGEEPEPRLFPRSWSSRRRRWRGSSISTWRNVRRTGSRRSRSSGASKRRRSARRRHRMATLIPACEAELFDPANRRYHYPFITCTDCGPRYTIRTMPYDRERTSMGVFGIVPPLPGRVSRAR
ncbi:MAG: acylphosphatase [Gemmatimonadales bacterium]